MSKSVQKEYLESLIVEECYLKMGLKTTMCFIKLKNGFELVTSSSCVDPENYNHELGKKMSKERAILKMWELEGYLLQNSINTIDDS